MKLFIWGSKGTARGIDLLAALLASLGHVIGYRNPQQFLPTELERPDGVLVLEADTAFERAPATEPGEAMGAAILRHYDRAGVPGVVVGEALAGSTDLPALVGAIGPALGRALSDPRIAAFFPPAPAEAEATEEKPKPESKGKGK